MGEWHQVTYWNQLRFTLKTWTGQETELGTLKTYTETRMNCGNSNGDYSDQDAANANNWSGRNTGITLNFAWIQLGGLRVGKDKSAFDTFIGYAGNVINDTIIPYGGFDTNEIQYYFDAGNGLTRRSSLWKQAPAPLMPISVPNLGQSNTNSGNDSDRQLHAVRRHRRASTRRAGVRSPRWVPMTARGKSGPARFAWM